MKRCSYLEVPMKKKLILGVLGIAAMVTPLITFAGNGNSCGGTCPFC